MGTANKRGREVRAAQRARDMLRIPRGKIQMLVRMPARALSSLQSTQRFCGLSHPSIHPTGIKKEKKEKKKEKKLARIRKNIQSNTKQQQGS